jgi:peptide/nickel transport system permease protein
MNKQKKNIEAVEESKGEREHRLKELNFMLFRIRKSPLSLLGFTIVIAFFIIALGAPLIAPPNKPDPYRIPQEFSVFPLPPSREHPFGTTGPTTYSDVFYGVIWGTRYSLKLSFTITILCLSFGMIYGSISGYYGGWIDEIMMRIVDLFYSMPNLVVMLAFLLWIGRPGFWTLVTGYSLMNWQSYARMVRGEILRAKNEVYIEAARSIGLSDAQIIIRHILPNVMYTIVIMACMRMGTIVLSTSSLGFLGVGLMLGTAEWGMIISEGRDWLLVGAWWITVFPGIFIALFVLGWTLLGDAFRDILDPKLRRSL